MTCRLTYVHVYTYTRISIDVCTLRVARLAEMNQVQDVAAVFVPRLKLTVTLVSVQQAITQSVKELGYDRPTDDQAEAL